MKAALALGILTASLASATSVVITVEGFGGNTTRGRQLEFPHEVSFYHTIYSTALKKLQLTKPKMTLMLTGLSSLTSPSGRMRNHRA
jgi:hypothetical protein